MKFNLPAFVYVKAFWEALASAIGGTLGVLVILGVLDPAYLWTPAAILTFVYSFLKVFQIEPQIKMREAIANAVVVKPAKSGKKAK